MRLPSGSYHRIKTYADGRRERLTISPSGRILESAPMRRVGTTKTSKSLSKRRAQRARRRRMVGR